QADLLRFAKTSRPKKRRRGFVLDCVGRRAGRIYRVRSSLAQRPVALKNSARRSPRAAARSEVASAISNRRRFPRAFGRGDRTTVSGSAPPFERRIDDQRPEEFLYAGRTGNV